MLSLKVTFHGLEFIIHNYIIRNLKNSHCHLRNSEKKKLFRVFVWLYQSSFEPQRLTSIVSC